MKAKKKCCKSRKRCRTCPVVLKRLEKAGLAERKSKRRWTLASGGVPKKAMKAARRK